MRASQVAQTIKNPLAVRNRRRFSFNTWGGKVPGGRHRQPTPVFLPGESHGQRTLVGYSPYGHKESDTTEMTHTRFA